MSKKDILWMYLMDLAYRRWGCHQLAERSFFFYGYQFPICARCTGVLIGYIISLFIFSEINYFSCTICASVMLLDWSLQNFNIKQSTNNRRLITGILGGMGCMSILLKVILLLIQNVL